MINSSHETSLWSSYIRLQSGCKRTEVVERLSVYKTILVFSLGRCLWWPFSWKWFHWKKHCGTRKEPYPKFPNPSLPVCKTVHISTGIARCQSSTITFSRPASFLDSCQFFFKSTLLLFPFYVVISQQNLIFNSSIAICITKHRCVRNHKSISYIFQGNNGIKCFIQSMCSATVLQRWFSTVQNQNTVSTVCYFSYRYLDLFWFYPICPIVFLPLYFNLQVPPPSPFPLETLSHWTC